MLRARHNEKECRKKQMKVKPATSFKLLSIFIHQKKKKKKKKNQDKIQNKRILVKSTFQVSVTKSLRNNPQEFIKQIL